MNYPSREQIAAGEIAARKAIREYSEFDSAMIPDSAIETVVVKVLTAALNLVNQKK